MEDVTAVLYGIFNEIRAMNLEEVNKKVAVTLVGSLGELGVPKEFWREVYSLLIGTYEDREALLDAGGLFNHVLDDFVERGLVDAKSALKLRVFVDYFEDVLFPRRRDCVRAPSVIALEAFFILAYGEAD
ncbi:hypothetical protein [Thermococcus aciditolerans]|uniref:Uncharacterized protein n=1 Tax=Thermococcus aciditolerans TaxID=2598455 RepID=A0A5C0SM22_9EURY|nr:hypothetical protein [Thermococcus aciditolerans]QEK15441.1 hypothetical protein FPV09_10485 [Thermococcus aciditolerans]